MDNRRTPRPGGVIISGVSLSQGSIFMYVSFDFLWWVVVAYGVISLLKTGDARWWLAIGAAIGLGMLTKLTMSFLFAGLVAGVLFTPARRYLKSPWLWAGVAVALLIFLPTLLWLSLDRVWEDSRGEDWKAYISYFTGDVISSLDLLDREIMLEADSSILTKLRSVQIMMQAKILSSSKRGYNRTAVEQISYHSLSSLGSASQTSPLWHLPFLRRCFECF